MKSVSRKTWNNIFVLICIILFSSNYSAQTSNISGVINLYSPVTAIDTLQCPDKVTVTNPNLFSPGDTVLIIQMKGAEFDSSNTAAFGSVINIKGAGNYEIARVISISGSILTLNGKLLKYYNVAGFVQLVKMKFYVNANVTASLTCQPWNGSTGGVLAFSVANNLQLNADVDVNGKGFRGGTISNNPDGGCGGGSPLYFYPLTQSSTTGWVFGGAQKGEGIGTISAAKQAGRGPLVNGGGGGNKHNTGGGGGSNFTAGGQGGDGLQGCNHITDGLGGLSLNMYYSAGRLFAGGGGGCGDFNNNVGTTGENGGGIIIISTGLLTGNNFNITANGNTVIPNGGGAADGAGGGGGGGSVFIKANTLAGSCMLTANGGRGGNQNSPSLGVGPGGGGGTGAILTNLAGLSSFSSFLSPGAAGVHLAGNNTGSSYGATPGVANTVGPLFNVNLNYTPDGGGSSSTTLTANASKTIICPGQYVILNAGGANSYTWYPGALTTSVILVSPTITTVYTVTGVNSGPCGGSASKTISVTYSKCTGIDNDAETENEITIYPNPAKDDLFIETGKPMEIIIYNQLGETVLSKKTSLGKNRLDLTSLNKGLYFIRVDSGKGPRITRLFKE